jgi:hypothetical protein
MLDVHMVCPDPSSRRKPPLSLSKRTPALSFRGLSRLATQQTALLDTVNHIARYLFVDTPGEKKPRVNDPPAETSVLPSVMLVPT